MIVRKRFVFKGSVQGVGFRWRARQAASLYDCTGWVRNEWDGTITMEIQGKEESIRKVLEAINAGRYIWIEDLEEEDLDPETQEYGFRTE